MQAYFQNVRQSIQTTAKDIIQTVRKEIEDLKQEHLRESETLILGSVEALHYIQRLEQSRSSRHLESVSKRLDRLEHQGKDVFTEPSLTSRSERLTPWISGFNRRCSAQNYDSRAGGQVVFWKYSAYCFPIGILTIGKASRKTLLDSDNAEDIDHESEEVEFTYLPPQWIADSIIKVSIRLETTRGGAPKISHSMNVTMYNTNPLTLEYLHKGDIEGLQRLFSKKEAQPTDILAPSGRSLLHVCKTRFHVLARLLTMLRR